MHAHMCVQACLGALINMRKYVRMHTCTHMLLAQVNLALYLLGHRICIAQCIRTMRARAHVHMQKCIIIDIISIAIAIIITNYSAAAQLYPSHTGTIIRIHQKLQSHTASALRGPRHHSQQREKIQPHIASALRRPRHHPQQREIMRRDGDRDARRVHAQ